MESEADPEVSGGLSVLAPSRQAAQGAFSHTKLKSAPGPRGLVGQALAGMRVLTRGLARVHDRSFQAPPLAPGVPWAL